MVPQLLLGAGLAHPSGFLAMVHIASPLPGNVRLWSDWPWGLLQGLCPPGIRDLVPFLAVLMSEASFPHGSSQERCAQAQRRKEHCVQ